MQERDKYGPDGERRDEFLRRAAEGFDEFRKKQNPEAKPDSTRREEFLEKSRQGIEDLMRQLENEIDANEVEPGYLFDPRNGILWSINAPPLLPGATTNLAYTGDREAAIRLAIAHANKAETRAKYNKSNGVFSKSDQAVLASMGWLPPKD